MSYPFSALELDARDFPAQEMLPKVYAVGCSYYSCGEWRLAAGVVNGFDDEDAEHNALKEFRKKFPECLGNLRHKVIVLEIGDYELEKAGYFR